MMFTKLQQLSRCKRSAWFFGINARSAWTSPTAYFSHPTRGMPQGHPLLDSRWHGWIGLVRAKNGFPGNQTLKSETLLSCQSFWN